MKVPNTVAGNLLELDYQNPENYSDIPDDEIVIQWIEQAYQQATPCTVSIIIVDKKDAQILNKQYRNKNYATNVLSFPFDPPPIPMEVIHLGDLVLCKQVVEQEAQEQNKAINDHWAHLIIHGILHLQGFDHISEMEAKEMENLEISLLKRLGIANPYLTTFLPI